MDPLHNTDALLIGTGEFSFSEGAISATDAFNKGYLDFGNVVAFTPSPELSKEEHIGSYRGVRRADKTIITENRLRYKLRVDEWNVENVRIMFGLGTIVGTWGQAALSAAAGMPIPFSLTNFSKLGYWYDIKTAAGNVIQKLSAVTFASLVEGADFVLDKERGRVAFLTNLSAAVTPVITAPLISTADPSALQRYVPLADPVKQGYGRLMVFDQNDTQKLVLAHRDFQCDITLDSGSEIDGTGFTDMTIDVLVGANVGEILLRNINQNATPLWIPSP